MYEEHPIFEKPTDENAAIWRYLDFTKLVSLLDRQALFFARADTLSDPFERSLPKESVRLRPVVYKDIPKESLDKMLATLASLHRDIRKFVLLNCWHMSENESAAMWSLHLKSDEGVAIRSSFKRLSESFKACEAHRVYIGKVEYIDYQTDWLPEATAFNPFLHKRKSFQHERELRAVILNLPVEGATVDLRKQPVELGAYVPVDLELLASSVYVAPTASSWFLDLVTSVTQKYGFNKDVLRSELDQDPVY